MKQQIFAENANYWDTTVHPAKSQAEIQELLEDFGVENMQFSQGRAGGKVAWLIRFEWESKSYRFLFTPHPCRNPSKAMSRSGKSRTYEQQAVYQMGRRAVHLVKAVLTAAIENPDVMFGFLELPAVSTGSVPVTAAELGAEGLTKVLPFQLPVVDGEFYLPERGEAE